jgi:hypothetical protein
VFFKLDYGLQGPWQKQNSINVLSSQQNSQPAQQQYGDRISIKSKTVLLLIEIPLPEKKELAKATSHNSLQAESRGFSNGELRLTIEGYSKYQKQDGLAFD